MLYENISNAYYLKPIEKDTGFVIGKFICETPSRVIYNHKTRDDLIVKVQKDGCLNQNTTEWNNWLAIRSMIDVSKWFAPCIKCSAYGSLLLMAKADGASFYPDILPGFLGDFRKSNYGLHNGKFVCIDYGELALQVAINTRFKVARWSDD